MVAAWTLVIWGNFLMNLISLLFFIHLISHTQKIAWGMALIWITLSCSWGLAKPINSLLSYNGFFPLSRLTYCTYLIHPTVMMLTSFQCESPIHLKHGMIVSCRLNFNIVNLTCFRFFNIYSWQRSLAMRLSHFSSHLSYRFWWKLP